MRTIFVLFDSLNRRMLEPYGSDIMATPNFQRLAERTVTFDNHYVGSLPCMPARRDLQTGRLSFLHRSWGPMEPFDLSLPQMMKTSGVYSHLITDHLHYFEDGGATYHTRFNSFEFVRGQEADTWKAMVQPPWERLRERYNLKQYSERPGSPFFHNIVNREYIKSEDEFPSVQCFQLGLEFLDVNRTADNWFLQIETFDPHEPFHAPERFRAPFTTLYTGGVRDWPPYSRVTEHRDECEELKANYMAVLALCDEQIGRLIDRMDALDLWRDTMLVVSTDHGYLLGEHDWWAKNRMHVYQEVAHIPLFIHHPACAALAGGRRSGLTQTMDLMPTFLDGSGLAVPDSVAGRSLLPMLSDPGVRVHDSIIYGHFGGSVNITDGRYTYFRYPHDMQNQELFQYTLMPTHMLQFFTEAELASAKLERGSAFSRGMPLLKVPVTPSSPWYQSHGPARMEDHQTVLFDLAVDPQQLRPLRSPDVEGRLLSELVVMLRAADAPEEAFRRFGLENEVVLAAEPRRI